MKIYILGFRPFLKRVRFSVVVIKKSKTVSVQVSVFQGEKNLVLKIKTVDVLGFGSVLKKISPSRRKVPFGFLFLKGSGFEVHFFMSKTVDVLGFGSEARYISQIYLLWSFCTHSIWPLRFVSVYTQFYLHLGNI